MFFTLKELVKWVGMTAFEMWLHLVSVLVFSVLSVIRYEGHIDTSWYYVFIPLFACDGLLAYFGIIVFIRMYKDSDFRSAAFRLLSSLIYVALLFVFKILLCQRLEGVRKTLSFSEIMSPLFVLVQIIMIRACQVN